LPCEPARACRCFGGIAESASDIAGGGAAEGAIAAGGAVRGPDSVAPPGFGPLLYGVNPGPPGFGPGTPIAFPPDGLAGCAPSGADNAKAAITATPVHKYFMLILLPMKKPTNLQLPASSARKARTNRFGALG